MITVIQAREISNKNKGIITTINKAITTAADKGKTECDIIVKTELYYLVTNLIKEHGFDVSPPNAYMSEQGDYVTFTISW